jgi:hypothetical protein
LEPLVGVQLPDSTYRIITNGKQYAPSYLKMETHRLDKSGKQIQHIGMGVPRCFDNKIYETSYSASNGITYISGTTNGCYPYVQFIFALNSTADSIKYIEYDTISSFYSLASTPNGVMYFKKTNLNDPIIHYNINDDSKTIYTDSAIYKKQHFYYLNYYPKGFIMHDWPNSRVCKYDKFNGTMIYRNWIDFDSNSIGIVSSFVTPQQDLAILYRRYNPLDSQWTDALALLDSNLNVKWVHSIPNTTPTIQTQYPYKTQCVLRNDNTFLVIKHRDTEQFISRTLLLHHIDLNGNLIKVDSLQLRPPEESFGITMVLKSAVTTFDNGLFLTMTSHGHGHPDYSRFPYLIKTDSNLQLPHRLNTGMGSSIVRGSFNLYPNPNTTGVLHLRFAEEQQLSQHATLTICNALGQQVKTVSGSLESLQQVNIEDVQPGCYVVELTTENGRYKSKLLVNGG